MRGWKFRSLFVALSLLKPHNECCIIVISAMDNPEVDLGQQYKDVPALARRK